MHTSTQSRVEGNVSLFAGWDLFAVEYNLTEPLATVFTPSAVTACARVSRCGAYRPREISCVMYALPRQ